MIAWLTASGASPGRVLKYLAATPATIGAAEDVPERVKRSVSPVLCAETMSTPGANTSTTEQKLEKGARLSF